MRRVLELLNVQRVFLELPPSHLEFDDGALVVVAVRVLRCRENRDHLREVPLAVAVLVGLPVVHAVALELHLVRPWVSST